MSQPLPHNTQIESAIIAAILLDKDIQTMVMPQINTDLFYDSKNQDVIRSVLEMEEGGRQIDLVTVSSYVKKYNIDPLYLTEICQQGSGSFNYTEYLQILKQLHIQRYTVKLSHELHKQAYDKTGDVDGIIELLEEAEKEIDSTFTGINKIPTLQENIQVSIQNAHIRKELYDKNDLFGIKTGFYKLNRVTNGWQNSDLIIIAARPAVGKTAICLHHAKAAARTGKAVRIYSLEMDSIHLTDRILLSECGFNHAKFSSGNLSDSEFRQLDEAAKELEGLGIYIDDRPARTIKSMHADARFWRKTGKCDIVIIDYMQLAEVENEGRMTLHQKVSKISKGCKAMAKDLSVPVIVLSQLNREVEKRTGIKMPELQDLRESGSIEEDADQVIFLYRPGSYGDDEIERAVKRFDLPAGDVKRMLFYRIAKNRNGPQAIVRATYNETLTQFFDYEPEIQPPDPPEEDYKTKQYAENDDLPF